MITYSENRVKTHIRKHLCPGGYVNMFRLFYQINYDNEKIANLFSTFLKDDPIIIYENQLWCHSFGSLPVVSTRKTGEL